MEAVLETSAEIADGRETVLRVLAAAAFLIFFQAYMIGPLIPRLSLDLHISTQLCGLLIPAYVLPYGISTLFYGPLSDRLGRRRVLFGLLLITIPATALTATAQTVGQLIAWRIFTGIATGGIIPLTLALIGDLFPYTERGRPMGWIFGAIAGGMAVGSTLAALIEPYLGWRLIFLIVAAFAAILPLWIWPRAALLSFGQQSDVAKNKSVLRGYLSLLSTPRGRRTYGYIFLNGAFHSGVFSFLGVYFDRIHHLSERGIGLALLGYGIPGLLLAPSIGRFADRWGRRWMITVGFFLAGAVVTGLCFHISLVAAAMLVTALSLGFDMTHPPLAGIVTTLDPLRRGQAMGLNAFVLFTGLGIGSLAFDLLMRGGFTLAFGVFAAVQFGMAAAAPILFRNESGDHHAPG